MFANVCSGFDCESAGCCCDLVWDAWYDLSLFYHLLLELQNFVHVKVKIEMDKLWTCAINLIVVESVIWDHEISEGKLKAKVYAIPYSRDLDREICHKELFPIIIQ
jgi:hypothetical protein